MPIDEQRIKSLLIEKNILTAQALQDAQAVAQVKNVSFLAYLLLTKIITKQQLGEIIAKSFNTWFVDLYLVQLSRQQTLKIPKEIAEKYKVVLYAEDETTVHLATDDPTQPKLQAVLANLFPNKAIGIGFALTDDIIGTFKNYQPPRTRLSLLVSNPRSAPSEIVEEIVREGVRQKASDIHIEPHEKKTVLRFRIDGVLHEIAEVSKEVYEIILNRFKVIAHLRIDEHHSPQDGAIRFPYEEHSVDLRISIVPTLDGEKIAIRVLSEYIGDLTLFELGLSPEKQKVLVEVSQKPFGMILITGPTSSGKTTTLYALIKILNKPEVNITTIEDPVEYKIAGVNQIQVDYQTKLTFANGLRSIVRQDPNVILVGEIRDSETVEIAVNAALTGHLVLSTFHANDSATAIPRLLDMGVEPFLVASTIQLIISQRLVRKVCPVCKISESYPRESLVGAWPKLARYFTQEKTVLYRGKGCDSCSGSGYKGREAIYEFIKMTPQIQDLIIKNPSTKQIWELAKAEGARFLFEEGMEKVKKGITTIEEVLRVASPEEVQNPPKIPAHQYLDDQ